MKAVEAVPPPAQVLGVAADPAHGHLVTPAPLPAADASPDFPSRSQGDVSGNCSDEDGFTVVETVTLKVLDFDYTTPAVTPSDTMVNGNAGPAALANGTLGDDKFLDSLASGAQTLKDDSNIPASKANIVANSPFLKMNGAVNGTVNTRPKNSINSSVLSSNSEPKILIIEKGNSKVTSDSGINVQNDLKSEDSSEGRPKTQETSSTRELSKPLTNLVMNSSNVIEKLKNEQATNKPELRTNEELVKGKVSEKLSSPLKQAIANGRALVNGNGPVNGLAKTKIASEVNRDSGKTHLSNGKHADCREEDIGLAAENGQITGNGFALMKNVEQPEKYSKGDWGAGLTEAEKGLDAEAEASWDRAVAGVKEQAFARLQEELRRAHQALKLRDEEVTRLSRIREEVEAELEELTASLFQEAHNMVREANVRQAAAERSYKESQMQVEVLTAEVAALKTLVLTSTPSRPNPHLHPQIDPRNGGGVAGGATASAAGRSRDDATVGGVSLFNRKHRRSPSHFNLKYGRENSPPESPVKEQMPVMSAPDFLDKDGWEVDPNTHKEFVNWKQNPKLDKADPFISRIYKEDINLCLEFSNTELSAKVQEAIEKGNIFIEAVSDKNKTVFPKKCALFEAPRQCHYRMKLGDQEQWYYISQICRNRITAVCDFLNYLRYIERGLVKSSVHDVFWEITRLRKEMVLARLGLALST